MTGWFEHHQLAGLGNCSQHCCLKLLQIPTWSTKSPSSGDARAAVTLGQLQSTDLRDTLQWAKEEEVFEEVQPQQHRPLTALHIWDRSLRSAHPCMQVPAAHSKSSWLLACAGPSA